MATNLCRCDQCDIVEEMTKRMYEKNYSLPGYWVETEVGDLCGDCRSDWEDVKKKFKESRNKKKKKKN